MAPTSSGAVYSDTQNYLFYDSKVSNVYRVRHVI
jgi:hypothetical protein